jgi:hypothetical protein
LDVERLIGSTYADVMIDVDEENGEVVVRLVLLYDRLFGAMSFFFPFAAAILAYASLPCSE